MTILLVEDNPKTRNFIKQTLYRRIPGIAQIIECEDEDQAVQLYEEYTPDWVLMDISLKIGDGLEATKKIVQSHSDAKIVIVTLYDEPEYRTAAQRAGALNYVVKDNISELVELIK